MAPRLAAPFRAAGTGLVLAAIAWACTDGTSPDATLRLLFDSATITPGANVQLTALDAEGEVVWSSDDPSIASVVSRTGWVSGVSTGTTMIRAADGASEATAEIRVLTAPFLRVSAPTATFEAVAGEADPAPISLAVTNDGDLPLTGIEVTPVTYGPGEPEGWLAATLTSTGAPAELRLSASLAGLGPGTYTATLAVQSPVSINGPQPVAVTLRVLRPPSISLDRAHVELGTTPGANSPPALVQVTNAGDRPLTGLSTSVVHGGGATGWLTAQLSSTSAPATLTLTALGAGLAQGAYSATVTVASGLPNVADRTIAVSLLVAPGPAVTLSTTDVQFTGVIGQADPPNQTVAVSNGGGGTLSQLSLGAIVYAGTSGWLTASLSGTTAPATVTLSVDRGGLAPGSYTASFTVVSPVADNSPRTVDVSFTIDEAPVINLSPPNLIFTSVRSKGDPPAQAVHVLNSGGGTLTGLSTQVTYVTGPAGWLDLSLTSTTGPTTLIAQPRAGSLAVGTYVARITFSSSVPGVADRTLTVQYEVKWSFQVDIQPFFTTTYGGFGYTPCTSCHFNGGNSPDLSSANVSYQALLNGGLITPGNPNVGRLLCKIEGKAGCGTAMPLPPAQIARIKEWIAQFAPY